MTEQQVRAIMGEPKRRSVVAPGRVRLGYKIEFLADDPVSIELQLDGARGYRVAAAHCDGFF